MVKIRLRRTGKKKQPSYRVVVVDSRSPRDGRFIEIIGHYNPVQQPKVLNIKGDRARYWLGVGAQPSETVKHLFKQVNILDSDGHILPQAEEPENGHTPANGIALSEMTISSKPHPPEPAAQPAPESAVASSNHHDHAAHDTHDHETDEEATEETAETSDETVP